LLIRCEGWEAETFSSAQEFLDRPRTPGPSCLVLDYSLPDLNVELQKRVGCERPDMPIIFVAGHSNVPMTVQAMTAGALEFLTKPFSDGVLLNAIGEDLDRSGAALRREADMQQLRGRYASLSCRERQVMALVVSGLLNKQVWGAPHQRDHREGPPRQSNAKDAGRFPCRPGENGREAPHPTRSNLSSISRSMARPHSITILLFVGSEAHQPGAHYPLRNRPPEPWNRLLVKRQAPSEC
jgi:FixJ family two-component response regulator